MMYSRPSDARAGTTPAPGLKKDCCLRLETAESRVVACRPIPARQMCRRICTEASPAVRGRKSMPGHEKQREPKIMLNEAFTARLRKSAAKVAGPTRYGLNRRLSSERAVWLRSGAKLTAIRSKARSWLWVTARISCQSKPTSARQSGKRHATL